MFTIGNRDLGVEKEELSKNIFAVKWHIIALQDAIEYLEHEFLMNRFHVTHCGGCAILFNKDTFLSDIKVTSIYLRDTRDGQQNDVKEEESGGVSQGVISRASFRQQPRGGKSFFTVMSLHINKNNYAKKRFIGKKLPLTIRAVMIEEHVDLVAGLSTGPLGAAHAVNPSVLSKKHSPTQIYRCHPAQVQHLPNGQTYAGFSSLRTLVEDGKFVSMVHSPFTKILRGSAQRIKAAIMRCGCTWPSLTITVTTNREKGMSNGSSRKDLLLISPARKETQQVRTKATVRFRPERQATARYRHNRPYVQHGSHEHSSRCTRSQFTKALVL